MIYDVAIIKGDQPGDDPAAVLHAALKAFAEQGWTLAALCPNGVNRWTVVVSRPSKDAGRDRASDIAEMLT